MMAGALGEEGSGNENEVNPSSFTLDAGKDVNGDINIEQGFWGANVSNNITVAGNVNGQINSEASMVENSIVVAGNAGDGEWTAGLDAFGGGVNKVSIEGDSKGTVYADAYIIDLEDSSGQGTDK